jgi:hypothetical protein
LWFVVITMWCGPSPSQCLGFYGGCLDETVRNILGPLRGWEGPASQDIHQSKRKNEIEWVKKDKFGHDWQPIEPSFSSIALTAPDPCTHTQLQGATAFHYFHCLLWHIFAVALESKWISPRYAAPPPTARGLLLSAFIAMVATTGSWASVCHLSLLWWTPYEV